jgi:PPOX class probable FMN-dependent enzyme
MSTITSETRLRELYGEPMERALRKQLDRLDVHCRRVVELSRFVVVATAGADGLLDATPRGGEPGFVRVHDERTLLIPDHRGNRRLDTLSNLVARPGIGLLFLVPGVDETLRVNGSAEIDDDPELRAGLAVDGRAPTTVVRVHVQEAYLHCAKALMRSRLWDPAARIPRTALPTMGEMMRDQVGAAAPLETHEQMVARYREELY